MQDQFLSNPRVQAVLKELGWGDRFEDDLASKIRGIEVEEELSFDEIREGLLSRGLVFRLKGGRGSPYLSLTDEGLSVTGRLQAESRG